MKRFSKEIYEKMYLKSFRHKTINCWVVTNRKEFSCFSTVHGANHHSCLQYFGYRVSVCLSGIGESYFLYFHCPDLLTCMDLSRMIKVNDDQGIVDIRGQSSVIRHATTNIPPCTSMSLARL